MTRSEAQAAADRLRILREELEASELRDVLALTPEQTARFEAWGRQRLTALAGRFDVDTTDSAARLSWGMRIASTLGGIALCAAIVLFFTRYWGYLDTWAQIAIVIVTPLLTLAATEYAARKERTLYFAGLLALLTLTAFVMNLVVVGKIFNVASTQNALLAWGAFAVLLAYRYGLRVMLVFGLSLLMSYAAAAWTAHLGYDWLDFHHRPENFALVAAVVFGLSFGIPHRVNSDFAAVYRAVGAVAFLLSVLSLAEWGAPSYLTFEIKTVERLYEVFGLLASGAAIWLGIRRSWGGLVNTGSMFFVIFLFCRLYHWWWDWMPSYLFFAIIGAIGIGLVAGFRRMRTNGAFA